MADFGYQQNFTDQQVIEWYQRARNQQFNNNNNNNNNNNSTTTTRIIIIENPRNSKVQFNYIC